MLGIEPGPRFSGGTAMLLTMEPSPQPRKGKFLDYIGAGAGQ